MNRFHDFHETSFSLFAAAFRRVFVCAVRAQVRFRDITKQAGINFVHNNGAAGQEVAARNHGSGMRIHRL